MEALSRGLFHWICSEVCVGELIGLYTNKFIGIDWCELDYQTLLKMTLFLAKQHILADQLELNIC